MLVDEKLIVAIRRMTDIEIARERARSGDLDGAIDLVTRILDAQFEAGTMMFRAPATTALVETLLARGGPGDVEAAERAIDRLGTSRPSRDSCCTRSRCCGCERCWPASMATSPAIGSSCNDFGPRRKRPTSRAIWRRPKRWTPTDDVSPA